MHPRLRENVWHIDPREERAALLTSRETFNVPTKAALQFLKMRTYCTGYNSVNAIAIKSDMSVADVNALLTSLAPAGILYVSNDERPRATLDEIRTRLVRAATLWSSELRLSYIGNEFVTGKMPRTALIGWLLEMYHYIREFPESLAFAASRASGPLRGVLSRYASQERGHERFVLATLSNLGLSKAEVEQSVPLLATRLVRFLMRELFAYAPWSVLPVAAMIEAQEFEPDQIELFKRTLCENYDLPDTAFDPYFEHQELDVGMGHAELLASNLELINELDEQILDRVANDMHDLKHAFDLQGIEIKAYYCALDGKYVPRQPVEFASI